jgi:hypothetical protein
VLGQKLFAERGFAAARWSGNDDEQWTEIFIGHVLNAERGKGELPMTNDQGMTKLVREKQKNSAM